MVRLSHVGTDFAPFRFSLQKNQSHAPSFLLFRKKAHSAQLLTCKRARDVSLSLPPFCEYACGANISMVRLSYVGTGFACSDFLFHKKISRSPYCSPFCDKSGMTEHMTDFSAKKNRNGPKSIPTWCRWPESNRHGIATGGF